LNAPNTPSSAPLCSGKTDLCANEHSGESPFLASGEITEARCAATME
jgi:hypothetical protein